jgi:hypothetical protein
MPRTLPPCLLLALTATSAWAQLQAGPEFRVNTYTTGNQFRSRVAKDAAGNFVVVWQSNQLDLSDIWAQRYDSSGVALGGEFRVNASSGSYETVPVAAAAGGGFMAAWSGSGYSGTAIDVRRYDSAGNPTGAPFHLNTYITGFQSSPEIAADRDGNFVVVWSSPDQDGHQDGIFGRRLSAAGVPIGDEFSVNTYTSGSQGRPRVAMDADGDFVVVWQSYGQDGSGFGVFGQRFSAAGVRQGGEFRVNTATQGWQRYPSLASDGAGNFVVAWDHPVGYTVGVYARRYAASGAPLAGEFMVTGAGTLPQASSAVGQDRAGNFVVTWSKYSLAADGRDIRGRLFDRSGVALGAEFPVNTFTTDTQAFSSVALGSHGDIVVAWESWSQDAPNSGGIYARRYSDLIFMDGFDPAGP